MKIVFTVAGLALIAFLAFQYLTVPKNSHLRGNAVATTDGRTYLAIEDTYAEGSSCKIDGKIWNHEKGRAGPVSPGAHKIECGQSGEIGFEIPPAVTFHFDYWGP